jgi:hypothetical protein
MPPTISSGSTQKARDQELAAGSLVFIRGANLLSGNLNLNPKA